MIPAYLTTGQQANSMIMKMVVDLIIIQQGSTLSAMVVALC